MVKYNVRCVFIFFWHLQLLTSSCKLQLTAEQELVSAFALYTHPPPTTHINLAVSQLPVVRSEHVRTLFDSTQSQESESEVCVRKFYAATRIKTHLDNTLYLSSLWSDLSKWGHFLIVLNLRKSNLRSSLSQLSQIELLKSLSSLDLSWFLLVLCDSY